MNSVTSFLSQVTPVDFYQRTITCPIAKTKDKNPLDGVITYSFKGAPINVIDFCNGIKIGYFESHFYKENPETKKTEIEIVTKYVSLNRKAIVWGAIAAAILLSGQYVSS